MKAALFVVSAALSLSSVLASPASVAARATATSSGKLPAVTVQGNAFFADGKRFYVRGIDYQPGGSSQVVDPIASEQDCMRDIPEFKKLGINTVRIYSVDNTANHDACMGALADAGIYLALDVNTPKYSLNRDTPGISYNDLYLQNIFATIDAFANYSNTLLFFSGNEVINDNNSTACAPYVKAVTRDMKQYIGSRGYRSIPVGYSAADVDSNRLEMAEFMNCGTDDERSDFFAFNDYSWCDPSSFTTSGWDQKVQTFSNYSIPLFLSEFGCVEGNRQFDEVASLYGDQMTSTYSGGLVYEYSKEGSGEGSKYGIVQLSGNSAPQELAGFGYLKTAYQKTPLPVGDGGYKQDGKVSQCPPKSSTWDVEGDELPAIPGAAKKFMTQQGAVKGFGLTGDGSQNGGGTESGAASTGFATAGSGKVSTTAKPVAGEAAASGSASASAGAAASLRAPEFSLAPFVCVAVVFMSTFLGTALL